MKKSSTALCLIFFMSLAFGQSKPLPRKYKGVYQGKQSSYSINTKEQSLKVTAAKLLVTLTRKNLTMQVGKQKIQGRLELVAKTKKYFSYKVFFNNGVIEYWHVFKKGKKILRKPTFPIPETFLFKK